jgi:hypothetical protein
MTAITLESDSRHSPLILASATVVPLAAMREKSAIVVCLLQVGQILASIRHFPPMTVRKDFHSSTLRSRNALLITETELKLIAALARIGLSSSPNTGYNTPAAIGTPSAL